MVLYFATTSIGKVTLHSVDEPAGQKTILYLAKMSTGGGPGGGVGLRFRTHQSLLCERTWITIAEI